MTTPLASVGFKTFSPEESLQLATVVAEKGQRIGTAAGYYVALTTETGSQLWAKLDEQNRPYAITPHYQGQSRNTVLLAQRIKYSNKPLDGRFLCWVNPNHNTPGIGGLPGDYTIIFESPDYAYYSFMEVPCHATVQFTATARDMAVFSSVEDYNNYPNRICNVSTVMNSSTTAGSEPAYHPEIYLCGTVEETKVLENPLTHYYFQWALVKVGNGYFDVCADTAMLESPMAKGGVIAGNFYVSGKLITD